MLKLNAKGFAHDFLAVLFVVIFAIAGVGYLVASHADTTAYTSTNEFPKFQYVLGSGTTAALTHSNSNNLLLQFNKGITGYHASDMAMYQLTLPANTTASSLAMNVSYVDAGYDTVFVSTGSASNRVWSVSKASTQTNQTVNLTLSNKPTVIYFGISAKGSSGGFSGTFPANRNLTVNSYTLKGVTTTVSTAPTVSLSANPTSVSSGSSSTLTWSSTNATSCTAGGAWSGTKATSGTASTGALSASSTYSLSCTGSGGSGNANTTVSVGASGSGGLVFNGTFSSGTIDKTLYPVSNVPAGTTSVVSDPDGSGVKVLKYAISDSTTIFGYPRADTFTPHLFTTGKDYYMSIPIKIPPGLPTVNGNGSSFFQWMETYEEGTGSPENPIGMDVRNHGGANRIDLGTSYDGYANNSGTGPLVNGAPWVGPAPDNKWHTAIVHMNFEPCGSTANRGRGAYKCNAGQTPGFVELWWDGVQQNFTFSDGSTHPRFYMQTLSLCDNGGCPDPGKFINDLNINSYRAVGLYPGTFTIYHGPVKIGTTLSSVAPDSGPTGP